MLKRAYQLRLPYTAGASVHTAGSVKAVALQQAAVPGSRLELSKSKEGRVKYERTEERVCSYCEGYDEASEGEVNYIGHGEAMTGPDCCNLISFVRITCDDAIVGASNYYSSAFTRTFLEDFWIAPLSIKPSHLSPLTAGTVCRTQYLQCSTDLRSL